MRKFFKWRYAIAGVALFILGFVLWQVSSTLTSAEPITAAEAQELVQDIYKGEIVEIKEEGNVYAINIQLDTGIYEIKIDRKSGNVDSMTRISKDTPVTDDKEKPTDNDNPTDKPEQPEKELTLDEVKEILIQQQKIDIKKVEKKIENNKLVYRAVVQQGNKEINYTVDAITGEIINTTTKEVTQPKPEPKPKKRITTEEAKAIALKAVNGVIDDVELEEDDGMNYYLIEIERNDDEEATVQIDAITGEVISIVWDD